MEYLGRLGVALLACCLCTFVRLHAEPLPEADVAGTVRHPSVKKYPTLVYVESVDSFKPGQPPKTIVMDQKGKAFAPRLLPILAGAKVEFLNNDNFEHNVFSPDFPPGEKAKRGQSYYDLGNWGKGLKRAFTFDRPGVYTQLCSLHPEMVGYVVALQNPYYAVADEEGKFRIAGVPTGAWKLKIWNERLKPKQLEKAYEVRVEAGHESAVTIEP